MADIGDIQVNAEGVPAKLTLGGWRPISIQQANSESEPPGVRFGKGFIGMDTSGEAGVAGQAAGIGSILAGPLTTGIRRGSAAIAGRVAQRVEAKVAANAAVQGAEAGFMRTPTGLVQRPSDALGRATLSGQAFRFAEAGADAVPGVNLIGLAQRTVNQRRTNSAFAQAIGLSDDLVVKARSGVTDDIFDAGLTKWADDFGEIEAGIDKGLDQVVGRALFDAVDTSPIPTSAATKAVVEQQGRVTGTQIKQLRSELTDLTRGNLDGFQRSAVKAQIEAVDDVIAKSLAKTDEALVEKYRIMRARYRVWISGLKGQTISPDGQINSASMNTALKSNFGAGYRAGRPVGGTDDINSYLATVREGAALNVGLPSSGTAERLIGVAAAGAAANAVFGD